MSEKKNNPARTAKIERAIFLLVLLSFALTMLFLILRIIFLRGRTDPTGRTAADYGMMIAQCVMGLVLMFLPSFIARRITLKIPSSIYVVYVVFLYFAIYLGEVRSFFYKIRYWDVLLHSFSGFSLGALGFSVVDLLNRDERVRISLSPFFVALFSFCFALSIGTVWEIVEFSIDGILGTNMQKYALESGVQLVGRAALTDTMKDLIVDSVGVLISTSVGYSALRRERKAREPEKKAEG